MKKTLFAFIVVAGLAATAATATAADSPLSRLGPEIRVNATTQGDQASPAVAGGALGSFVAVWLGPDGSGGQRVFGQRFDALGARQGGEIRISSEGNVTARPRVARSPDGGFVAVWISGGVQVRFYGPDGAPRGEAARVDVPATQVQDADVAVGGAGQAMVVWTAGGPHGRILARRYDLQGQPVEEQFAVRADHDLTSSEVRVAAAPGGDFLAVWSEKGTGTGDALWMRRFDAASKAWGSEVRATPMDGARHYEPLAAFRPDGSFFLAWTQIMPVFYPSISNADAWVRDFQGDGAPEGDGRSLFTFFSGPEVSLAVGRDGNVLMVVTATEHELDGILYDRSWHPLLPPLKIHADVLSPEVQPAVAAAGGSFVAVWTRGIDDPFVPAPAWSDGSASGIFGQRLGDSRCAAGSGLLCVGAGGRFEARVDWKNPNTGETGTGKALPLTADTGAFWFFDPANLELMIKVLDGRSINGSFWVFYGSLSNVEYTVTVTDTTTGTVKTYHNAPLQLASRADVDAFPALASSLTAGAAEAKAAPVPPVHPASVAGTCDPSQGLCLAGDRFQAQVDFIDPRTGSAGKGQAVPLTDDTGAFWFFDPTNLELMVKVLDGRAVNGHFWVFSGALSDVAYTITVTDTETGQIRVYHNAPHQLASRADVNAFPGGLP